jgi:glycogen(starch) synthase
VRVLMVSWEFPPLVIGGLAAHVDGLSRALSRQGHEVVVLTLHHPDVPERYEVEGVRVLRSHADLPWLPPENFIAHMASANHQLVQLSTALGSWEPDLVHAHDWLAAWAGDTLHALYGVPLVATIHATEKGRNGGHVPPGQPAGIHAVEWWLTYQANRVIACSRYMVEEVEASFDLPPDKIFEVPNAVDPAEWRPPDPPPVRGEDGPLLVSWGRLQYEKGFQFLVEAMASLRRRVPGIHLVIAGRGSHLSELEALAQFLGVADIVEFAGFVPDDELKGLLHRASCVVVPSLYEPFGIVALEALAAGAPLVAAASGGMAEVLEGTDAGLLVPPGDAGSLAQAVERMLHEPGLAQASAAAGERLVTSAYSWDAVVRPTLEVYRAAGAGGLAAPLRRGSA